MLSHSSKRARSTIDTRETDRDHREQDNHINEVAESWDTGIDGSDDEGGGAHVDEVVAAKKALVVPWDQEADEEEGQDVEERDSPEDLLDGAWQSFLRVLALGGRETDELGAGEGESGGDEDAAEAWEAGGEGSWVVPCAGSPVL